MTALDIVLADFAEVVRADQIADFLGRVGAIYGMKTVAYLAAGTPSRRLPGSEPYIAVTYSADWIERYRVRGYLKIDPAVQIGLMSCCRI